jgi:hypothetical protein
MEAKPTNCRQLDLGQILNAIPRVFQLTRVKRLLPNRH